MAPKVEVSETKPVENKASGVVHCKTSDNCPLSETEMKAHEDFISKNEFFSGKGQPSAKDRGMINLFTECKYKPDQNKYPQLHGWYWYVVAFKPEAQATWPKDD